MKRIYFAIDKIGNFTAATSLTDIAGFLGYNPESLRREFRRVNGDKIELAKGTIYKAELSTIQGRGNLQNLAH